MPPDNVGCPKNRGQEHFPKLEQLCCVVGQPLVKASLQ